MWAALQSCALTIPGLVLADPRDPIAITTSTSLEMATTTMTMKNYGNTKLLLQHFVTFRDSFSFRYGMN